MVRSANSFLALSRCISSTASSIARGKPGTSRPSTIKALPHKTGTDGCQPTVEVNGPRVGNRGIDGDAIARHDAGQIGRSGAPMARPTSNRKPTHNGDSERNDDRGNHGSAS